MLALNLATSVFWSVCHDERCAYDPVANAHGSEPSRADRIYRTRATAIQAAPRVLEGKSAYSDLHQVLRIRAGAFLPASVANYSPDSVQRHP
jgi:hypothetical protein